MEPPASNFVSHTADLPIDPASISADELYAAFNSPAVPEQMNQPVYDSNGSIVPAHVAQPPEPAAPVAAEEPAPEPAPEAAPATETDDDPRTLDEDVARFAKGEKRIRLTNLNEKDVRAVLAARRGDGDILDGIIGQYTPEEILARLPKTVPKEETTAAEATPAQPDAVEALDTEIAGIEEALATAKANFDADEEARLDKEWRSKQRAMTKLLATRPAEAKAPEPEPEPALTEAQIAALQAESKADWERASGIFPDLSDPKSPHYLKMLELKAELEQRNDSLLESSKLGSTLAFQAAAALGITPQYSPATQPVTRQVPGPSGASASRPSTAPPPKVDVLSLAQQINPYDLPELLGARV